MRLIIRLILIFSTILLLGTALIEPPIYFVSIIKKKAINIREKPDINSKIIRTVRSGHKLNIISKDTDWVKVKDIDSIGFVYSSLIGDANSPNLVNIQSLNFKAKILKIIAGVVSFFLLILFIKRNKDETKITELKKEITNLTSLNSNKTELEKEIEFFETKLSSIKALLNTTEIKLKEIEISISKKGYSLSDIENKINLGISEKQKLTNTKKELTENCNKISEELSTVTRKLERTRTDHQEIVEFIGKISELQTNHDDINDELMSKKDELEDIIEEISNDSIKLSDIQKSIDLYTNIKEFTDIGHFIEPHYIFNTSDRYREEIKTIRDQQRTMVKDYSAVNIPHAKINELMPSIPIGLLDKQAKLMLRTFNIECDHLIGSVKPSNFPRTLERLEQVAEQIEDTSATLLCGFSKDYVDLKFKECELQYHFLMKKQEEQELIKAKKEAIREDEKLRREYEASIKKTDQEMEGYQKLLDKAVTQVITATDSEKQKLNIKIELLNSQIKESEEKRQRTMSLAEQTRKGIVYVISNIGSYGEGVFKIGLTRREDPNVRVKELSSASVPFPFEQHILVYCEDAPTLETKLHREFRNNQINAANNRKEFFKVPLVDIIHKINEIKENTDYIENIRSEPKAEEYYESRRLNGLITNGFQSSNMSVNG